MDNILDSLEPELDLNIDLEQLDEGSSVSVFPPSEANRVREGYLKGESVPGELCCAPSKFFMIFDTLQYCFCCNGYIFFVTLLSIPKSSFSVALKMFDLDNNGDDLGPGLNSTQLNSVSLTAASTVSEIDKNEFKKVMALIRAQKRHGVSHKDGLHVGLKVSGSVENGGLLEYFFGKDGKACLEHGKFVQFLRDLHNE
ncbi:hypothetical protein RJ640_006058, partial [Escallonia rubra]